MITRSKLKKNLATGLLDVNFGIYEELVFHFLELEWVDIGSSWNVPHQCHNTAIQRLWQNGRQLQVPAAHKKLLKS